MTNQLPTTPEPTAEAQATIAKLSEELIVTDQILAQRTQVMAAIPPCPVHGSTCVPHALEWIETAKQVMGQQPKGNNPMTTPTPPLDDFPLAQRISALSDAVNEMGISFDELALVGQILGKVPKSAWGALIAAVSGQPPTTEPPLNDGLQMEYHFVGNNELNLWRIYIYKSNYTNSIRHINELFSVAKSIFDVGDYETDVIRLSVVPRLGNYAITFLTSQRPPPNFQNISEDDIWDAHDEVRL